MQEDVVYVILNAYFIALLLLYKTASHPTSFSFFLSFFFPLSLLYCSLFVLQVQSKVKHFFYCCCSCD